MKRENFLKLGSSAATGNRPVRAAATVIGWNRLALQAIRTAQPGPLPSARALAILHTCMYNAWAAYDETARQTAHGVAVRLPRAERSAASKACAMSHAAYGALAGRFPAQQAAFDAWMAGLGLDPAAPASLAAWLPAAGAWRRTAFPNARATATTRTCACSLRSPMRSRMPPSPAGAPRTTKRPGRSPSTAASARPRMK